MTKQPKYMTIGIDHGTSNSAIAVMESTGVRIIQPTPTDQIMPSVVFIDKHKIPYVGKQAREAILTIPKEEGNGVDKYKPEIGSDISYRFSAAGVTKTGTELGGMVIRELLRFYEQHIGLSPKAAVITVPAMFDQAAVDGTRKAAKLAGLEQHALLQEPVAAALAYGFSAKDQRARWLVFDLGGGTLDVSLVVVRDGEMHVPEDGHAGDNHLGGRNFDQALYEYLIDQLSRKYSLEQFRSEPQYRQDRSRLMVEVENAKIKLSSRNKVTLEVDFCCDDNKQPVHEEIEVKQHTYEGLIANDVIRAVQVVETLLKRNRLSSADVDACILIGGPTKTPYLQKVLKERFDITLLDHIDPMTAVAQGAAVYAITQQIDKSIHLESEQHDQGEIWFSLSADAYSKLPTCTLFGQVHGNDLPPSGLTVEAERTDGLWRSGRVPVAADGSFEIELHLIDEGRSVQSGFKTRLFGDNGEILAHQEEPAIWYPFSATGDEARLPASLRVGKSDGKATRLLDRGINLPAKKQGLFKTTKSLKRGTAEDMLRIPVIESVPNLEGEETEYSDCGMPVGALVIHGNDKRVSRDLPEGSEIELSLYADTSREILVTAYVPLLDEDFEANFEAAGSVTSVESLRERLDNINDQLAYAQELHEQKAIPEAIEILNKIEEAGSIKGIQADLDRADQAYGAEEAGHRIRSHRRIAELQGTIRRLQQLQQGLRIERKLKALEQRVHSDQREEKNRLKQIKQDLKRLGKGASEKDLGALEQEINEVDNKLSKYPVMWLVMASQATVGHRFPHDQIELLEQGQQLVLELIEKGGLDKITASDLRRVEKINERIRSEVDGIDDLIKDYLNKKESDVEDGDIDDLLSHIK